MSHEESLEESLDADQCKHLRYKPLPQIVSCIRGCYRRVSPLSIADRLSYVESSEMTLIGNGLTVRCTCLLRHIDSKVQMLQDVGYQLSCVQSIITSTSDYNVYVSTAPWMLNYSGLGLKVARRDIDRRRKATRRSANHLIQMH
jgi:hypothetical protein